MKRSLSKVNIIFTIVIIKFAMARYDNIGKYLSKIMNIQTKLMSISKQQFCCYYLITCTSSPRKKLTESPCGSEWVNENFNH